MMIDGDAAQPVEINLTRRSDLEARLEIDVLPQRMPHRTVLVARQLDGALDGVRRHVPVDAKCSVKLTKCAADRRADRRTISPRARQRVRPLITMSATSIAMQPASAMASASAARAGGAVAIENDSVRGVARETADRPATSAWP
jgi:hypothetical protein